MNPEEILEDIYQHLNQSHLENIKFLIDEFQKERENTVAIFIYKALIQRIKEELQSCDDKEDIDCRRYILSQIDKIYEKKLLELKVAIDNSQDYFAEELSRILLTEARKILAYIQKNYSVPVTFYCCYTPMESVLIHKFFPADPIYELTFDFGSLLLLSAQVYYFKDDIDKAMDLMKEVLAINPVNSEFLIQIADMERARGNKITSETYLDKAMDYVFEEYYYFNILNKKAEYLEDDGDVVNAEKLKKVIQNTNNCYLYVKNPPKTVSNREEHLQFVKDLEEAGINLTISEDIVNLLKEQFLSKDISMQEHVYFSNLLMALIPPMEFDKISARFR